MPVNENKDNSKKRRKAKLEERRLKIKKELEEIIKKTDEQNKALERIMKETRY